MPFLDASGRFLYTAVQFIASAAAWGRTHFLRTPAEAPALRERKIKWCELLGTCVCGVNYYRSEAHSKFRAAMNLYLDRKRANLGTYVIEVTGVLGAGPPQGGAREFFHVGAILGEHAVFWRLRLVGFREDPARLVLHAKYTDEGLPMLISRWGLVLELLDQAPTSNSWDLQVFRVLQLGALREPFKVDELKVEKELLDVQLLGERERVLLWYGLDTHRALREGRVQRRGGGGRRNGAPEGRGGGGGGSGGTDWNLL
jgi:hypothetical protein